LIAAGIDPPALPRQKADVRILSGAPLPNKAEHSGRSRPAAYYGPFENRPAAHDADFLIILCRGGHLGDRAISRLVLAAAMQSLSVLSDGSAMPFLIAA